MDWTHFLMFHCGSVSMNRGKKSNKLIEKNSKIYMDLKNIIRENALQFLPAKSLRRCASVCRDWRIQMLTPFFAHRQSNSFRDLSGFFYQFPSGNPSFLPLDPMAHGVPDPSLRFLPEAVDVRCSSNGLLCCQGCTGNRAYYICNPVTRQWKKLPPHVANHGPDPALVLIFEPSLLNFVAEYKLICAFPSDLDGYEFEIYSSEEGSWRTSPEIIFGNWHIIPKSGVHVSGVVYWQLKTSQLLAFDLVSERYTLLYGASGYGAGREYSRSSLGAINGKLFFASLYITRLSVEELSNSYTNTMQMNSKTQAWKVRHNVALECPLPNVNHYDQTVQFIGDGLAVIRSENSLFSFSMKTKEIKQLPGVVDVRAVMVPYVNSLVEI